MATQVDIAPALGHGLVASQVGPVAGYDAVDIRRAWSPGLQEGAITAGSYEVVQRAAGANMTVDVNANVGDGALVQGDSVTGQGLYRVPPVAAAINVDIAAAHATNPRVDIVVLECKDDTHDVGGLNVARVRVVTGTATGGATLANRTGAPALPASSMLLADVHVPATDTTIANTQIRDRRTWALGAYVRIVRNANAAAGSDYAPTGTNIEILDATNVAPRIECSGVPVKVTLSAFIAGTAASNTIRFSPQVDSLGVNGMADVGEAASSEGAYEVSVESELATYAAFTHTFIPAAGSHVIAPGVAKDGLGRLLAQAKFPLTWVVEEIVRQNTANNVTTSG